jgi:uncharacterized protein YfaS (alpha-2-macroglobulin family)
LRIAVKDLLTDQANRLVIARGDGAGALYYTAHFNMQLPASQAKAISRGVRLKREYFLSTDDVKPISEAHVGDVITVRLTIEVPQAMQYFNLEDTFPAGTEPIDTDLLNTSKSLRGEQFEEYWHGRFYDWYWGWWYFQHTTMSDSHANLYSDYLPAGTYVYSYQLHASTPGEYQTIPAVGYTFYYSEVFGRSEGTLFRILPPANQ